MTLNEIRDAILRLTEAERLELLNWMLDSFDADELFRRRSFNSADKTRLHGACDQGQPHYLCGDSFVNLQAAAGGKAKSYQVRQVRAELKSRKLKP